MTTPAALTTAIGAVIRVIAIYLRISNDPENNEKGIRRQEKEVRELIAREGREGPVIVYEDNDVSAADRSKQRPEYQRMLADIQAGRIAAVYAWNTDRIIRHPLDLEDYISACGITEVAEAVPTRTVRGGHYDFTTVNGRMVARILAATALAEVEITRERIQAKTRERREAGEYYLASKNGEARWCHFVYEQNGDGTLRANPLAAAQYLSEVKRLLAAGAGARLLATFARERNAKGIRPLTSKRGTGMWGSTTVGVSLMSATPAAVNETPERTPGGRPDYSRRVKAADGNWPAVTGYDTVLAVRAILTDPEHRQKYYGRAPSHLLTGLLACGVCGQRSFCWHKAYDKLPDRYVCKSADRRPGAPGTGYCVTHRAGQLDEFITMQALALAAQPGVTALFTRPAVDVDAFKAERTVLRTRWEELADQAENGGLSAAAWSRNDANLTRKMDALTGQITSALRTDAGAVVLGIASGDHPLAVWERATVIERRQALAGFIDHITVLRSAKRGRPKGIPSGAAWPFDPDRIQIEWNPLLWGFLEDPAVRAAMLTLPGTYARVSPDGHVTRWQPGGQAAEAFAAGLQPALVREDG